MHQYRAFISYSHSDSRYAIQLQRSLENFRLAQDTTEKLGLSGNQLGTVFRDASDLGAASELSAALTDALAKSNTLIVVCSPGAASSKWVDQEVREYRRIHGANAHVLPVIAPTAGDAPAEDLFPAALGAVPPLAADSRNSGDGRRLAFLKIVAGLLGAGLDELVRRDTRRRQRRLLAGTFASTAIAVTLAVFAAFALSAREDARRRLSQSEDLIGFMLVDLRDQLTPLGQVSVLQSVGDKALAYFESLPDSDLTDAALLRKSRALYQIGDVYFELGEFQAAHNSFQLSLDQARQLAAAQPDENERLFELGQAEFWTGYSAWYAGDLDLAEWHLNAYFDVAWALHEREPDNPGWIMETFWASNNLGSLAFRRSRFDAARDHFEDAIARINVLIDEESTTDRLFERSTVQSWLGYAHYHRGDLAASRSAYLSAIDKELDSSNALYAEERSFQMGQLAEIELHLGNMKSARSLLEESIRIATRLSNADPDSMELLFARTLQNRRLANVSLYDHSAIAFTALAAAAKTLLNTDEPPSTWRRLAFRIADIGARIRDPDALMWATQLIEAMPDDISSHETMEWVHLDLATSIAAYDDSQIARVQQWTPLAAAQYEESRDFVLVLPLLRAYELLGDSRRFSDMRDVLTVAGSRHPDFFSPTAR